MTSSWSDLKKSLLPQQEQNDLVSSSMAVGNLEAVTVELCLVISRVFQYDTWSQSKDARCQYFMFDGMQQLACSAKFVVVS